MKRCVMNRSTMTRVTSIAASTQKITSESQKPLITRVFHRLVAGGHALHGDLAAEYRSLL